MGLFNIKSTGSGPASFFGEDNRLKPILKFEGSLENLSELIPKILDESENVKCPILIINIQFKNNDIVESLEEKLEQLKNNVIKFCFSFKHYNAEEEDNNKKRAACWKKVFTNAEHVFFANAKDQEVAIDKNHIPSAKSSTISSLSKENHNILITGKTSKELLKEASIEAKKLSNNPKIIVADTPLTKDNITNLIMDKFGAEHEDFRVVIQL